jgi:hypothetical protein
MIEKVVKKVGLKESSAFDLEQWLKKSPEDRVSALEYLRRQYGSTARLQRTARIVQRPSR